MKKKQDENMTRLGEMSTWQDECYQEGLNSKNKVMEARGKLREAYETRFCVGYVWGVRCHGHQACRRIGHAQNRDGDGRREGLSRSGGPRCA